MPRKPIVNVVTVRCRPEDEEKFERWYEETHLPMLMKFKEGIKEVRRYRAIGLDSPEYLNIYTFDSLAAYKAYRASPEEAAAMAEKKATWGEGGPEVIRRVQYEPVKTWKR